MKGTRQHYVVLADFRPDGGGCTITSSKDGESKIWAGAKENGVGPARECFEATSQPD